MFHFRAPLVLAAFAVAFLPLRAPAVDADPLPKLPEIGTEAWQGAPVQGGIGEVIWADSFGPFVMLGRNAAPAEARTLWNLADRKAVGKIPGKFDVGEPYALAPSGKYLACGRGFAKADLIAVFDAVKGKPLFELKNPARISRLQFLADDKLAAFADNTVALWDVAGKKIVGAFTAPKEVRFGAKFVVSHTGKTVGILHDNSVKLFDAKGAEVASYKRPMGKPTDHIGENIDEAALHPDGKTLALLIAGFKGSNVTLLDITTGEFREPIAIDEKPAIGDRSFGKIAWSLDGEALLVYRKLVIDPKVGKPLWQFPEEKNPSLRRGLLSVQRGLAWTEGNNSLTLAAVEYDDMQLADLRKSAALTGTKVAEANRPKLTETSLTGVKAVTFPASFPYAVKPPAVTAPGKIPDGSLPIEGKEAQIGRVLFAPAASLAFVEILDGEHHFVSANPRAPAIKAKAVDAYNLDTGRRTQKLEIGFGSRPVAVSPDGKEVAVLDADNGERIDLIRVEDGTAHLAFRPFADRPQKKVTFAHYVGAAQLLLGNGDSWVVWKLPEAKPEVELKCPAAKAVVSMSGALLALADGEGVKLFDAATLAPLGDLKLPDAKAFAKLDAQAVAFRADQKELAVYHKAGKFDQSNGAAITVWDLETGKGTASAFVKNALGSPLGHSGAIEFAEPGYFLLDQTSFVSMAKLEVVWTIGGIGLHRPREVIAPLAGRHWSVGTVDVFSAKSYLAAANLSNTKIPEWVRTVETAPAVLWKPGMAVRVSVQIPNGGDEAKKKLEAALTQQGFAVKDDAANAITVTATENATGKTQEYKSMGIRRPGQPAAGGTTTINIVQTVAKAQLTINGKAVWESQGGSTNTGHMVEHIKEGEDLGARLNTQMQAHTANWAGSAVPPRTIVQTQAGVLALPGRGSFTAKGLEITPPVLVVKP